jgi:hypothetical protein
VLDVDDIEGPAENLEQIQATGKSEEGDGKVYGGGMRMHDFSKALYCCTFSGNKI